MWYNYSDVIMSAMASNHQHLDCLLSRLLRRASKKASKLRVTGRWPIDSHYKGPVMRKFFSFDDVSMLSKICMDYFEYVFGEEKTYKWTEWSRGTSRSHDDVMIWRRLPHCWSFARGIHRSPVVSPHKGAVTWTFDEWLAGDLWRHDTHVASL